MRVRNSDLMVASRLAVAGWSGACPGYAAKPGAPTRFLPSNRDRQTPMPAMARLQLKRIHRAAAARCGSPIASHALVHDGEFGAETGRSAGDHVVQPGHEYLD